MGELNENRWAVLSERGREAAGLTYAEAARLIGRLREEKVSGLCVITGEAAARLAPPPESPSEEETSAVGGPTHTAR